MSFLYIPATVIIILYLIKISPAESFSFHPGGFKRLFQVIAGYGFHYTPKNHLVLVLISFAAIAFCGYCFELQPAAVLSLALIISAQLPFLVLWQRFYLYQERNFNSLSSYLQQFIACFKINPKIYGVLTECSKTDYGELNDVIKLALQDMEQGLMAEKSLERISERYPHYIVHNLHVLAVSVENYGADEYTFGLEIIQDDIDDWIEDIYQFKQLQINLKNKIILLCAMSVIIAWMSREMLFSVKMSLSNPLYQSAIYLFLLLDLMTLFQAHKIYREPWLKKGEGSESFL